MTYSNDRSYRFFCLWMSGGAAAVRRLKEHSNQKHIMTTKVQPIPEGYHSLTPYLIIKGADKAIEFYIKAFGAEELFRMPTPDGKAVMHAELKIGDSRVMLSEESPEHCSQAPQTLGGTPVSLYFYVEDADQVFAAATAAGAQARTPLTDMFWGDRFGQVVDPFGHVWSIATRKENLTDEQFNERAREFACS
jgi:PhnB protein